MHSCCDELPLLPMPQGHLLARALSYPLGPPSPMWVDRLSNTCNQLGLVSQDFSGPAGATLGVGRY